MWYEMRRGIAVTFFTWLGRAGREGALPCQEQS